MCGEISNSVGGRDNSAVRSREERMTGKDVVHVLALILLRTTVAFTIVRYAAGWIRFLGPSLFEEAVTNTVNLSGTKNATRPQNFTDFPERLAEFRVSLAETWQGPLILGHVARMKLQDVAPRPFRLCHDHSATSP